MPNYEEEANKIALRSSALYNELCSLGVFLSDLEYVDVSSRMNHIISEAKGLHIDLYELQKSWASEIEYDDSVIEDLSDDYQRVKKQSDELEVENHNLRRTIEELRSRLNELECLADVKHDADYEYDELSRLVYKLYKRGKKLRNDDKHDLDY